MYNLDFTGAHATFHQFQQANPNDPMGYVSNAAAYLFSEFERLHVLESDLFVDDKSFDSRRKLTPDPAIKAEFDSHLAKAEALADAALAKNPKDSDALFAKVLANGLRSDYAALIEKRNVASLGYMKTVTRAGRSNCSPSTLRVTMRTYRWGRRTTCWERTLRRSAGC